MKIDQNNWLPHLKNFPTDIEGYKTCTYVMALEGWRRGLRLRFHITPGIAISHGIEVSLSDGNKEHFFKVSRGDKVTKEAINICMQKPETYNYLRKEKVPIPEGSYFEENVEDKDVIAYVEEIGYPLVLKPSDAGSGRGVITNIQTMEEFKKALQHVRYTLGFKNIIVERFITGEDYRIYVVDDRVVGAYKRKAANVIGDGNSTVESLIHQKNKLREKNPFIGDRPIKINKDLKEYLEEQQLTLQSIIPEGKRIYLRAQGKYLKERDPVDITDELSEEIKTIAVNAMHAIPGLTHCDVDMLVNEETGEGYVNEINSRPQISNHLFPLEGPARDVPAAIMDFYFPETKNQKRNDNYYFDFNPVYNCYLANGSATMIEIPMIPNNHKLTRYRLTGKLQNVNYEKWLRKKMASLKLYGYIKHLKNNETSVVVSGTPASLRKFNEIIRNDSSRRAKVKTIKQLTRTAPIKLMYEQILTKKDYQEFDDIIKRLEKENKELRVMNRTLIKETTRLQKEYRNIVESSSWKLTKGFRSIKGIIKKS